MGGNPGKVFVDLGGFFRQDRSELHFQAVLKKDPGAGAIGHQYPCFFWFFWHFGASFIGAAKAGFSRFRTRLV